MGINVAAVKNRQSWVQFLRKHQGIVLFLCIFLLLFLGGYRFHFFDAFLFSFVDALYLMFFYDACSWTQKHIRLKNRVAVYVLLLVALQVVIWGLIQVDDILLSFTDLQPLPENDLRHLLKVSVLVLGTYIVWLIANMMRNQRKMEQLQLEKKEMELRVLRSQLNPHFVFNTLNNIYALVYTHDEKAPDSILKMAEMCRYITDECQGDYVNIEKEIHYIQNYIDLQKMKLGEKNVVFEHAVDNNTLKFPPMLLQPFVENCFNHSDIASNPQAFIRVKISLHNRQLTFEAVNSKNQVFNANSKHRDGIGIGNVQQQLKHYYEGNHKLNIEDRGSEYCVFLQINLNK